MSSPQILRSTYRPLVSIVLPPFQGRQMRYHTFSLSDPQMPEGFEDFRDPVLDLISAAGASEGEAHLTVDEKLVKKGMSQRRPGPHVDGCFRASQMSWGGGGGGGWLHYCNDVGASSIGRMAVIVAASVPGCRAWKGVFEGRPAKDGDLSHLSDQLGEGEILGANFGFLLSPDCVHESLVFKDDTLRTFLRIALPVAFSEASVFD